MSDANLGDGAIGLSEADRAALRLQIRQALVTAWRDDYSVGTVVSGVTECLEDYLAAVVREHTERAWDEGWTRGAKDMNETVRWGETNCERPTNPYAARQERDPR